MRTVTVQPPGGGPPDIDIKKYAKVEKLPGGSLEDCRVLSGVMFQKVGGVPCRDMFRSRHARGVFSRMAVLLNGGRKGGKIGIARSGGSDLATHLHVQTSMQPGDDAKCLKPSLCQGSAIGGMPFCKHDRLRVCMLPGQDVVSPGRMRRKIHNPRVLLLDCPLEYKKGENQTNVELTKEEDWCAPGLALPLHVHNALGCRALLLSILLYLKLLSHLLRRIRRSGIMCIFPRRGSHV